MLLSAAKFSVSLNFVEAFREMWMRGKSGFNLAHLRRILRIENEFLTRDLNDMVIYRSVVTPWLDQSMAWIYQRYVAWLGMAEIIEDAEELRAFHAMGKDIADEAEFFLASAASF